MNGRTKRRGKNSPCIFCQIAAGKAEAYRLDEDKLSLAILDINPFTQGHCLVIPKRHVPWWHDMTEDETRSLFSLARRVSRRLMQTLRPDFVCMYARGRRIPHTHIFLVPSFGGDLLDRVFNALEKAQEFPEEIARVKEKKAMKKTAGLLKGKE